MKELSYVLIGLVVLSTLSSFAMTIISIYKRESPRSLYFTLMSVCMSLYMLGYLMEITSVSIHDAFHATLLEYMGLPYITPLAVFFVMDYFGRRVPKLVKFLMLLIPANATVLVAFQPYIGVYYKSMRYVAPDMAAGPPFAQLRVEPTPIYVVTFAYMVGCLCFCVGAAAYHLIKAPKGQRRRDVILLAATALPLISQICYLAGVTPYGFDLSPVILSVTTFLLGYTIFRLNLLQLLPMAKAVMIERMKDAFIVLDLQGRYMDANQAAKTMFPQLAAAGSGTPLKDIDGMPLEALAREDGEPEFWIESGGERRYYRSSRSEVAHKGAVMCSCIMLYDITEARKLMDELQTLATYDNLTGIYNRRSFIHLAEVEFERVQRRGGMLAILMLDLDFFKSVNDTYGHICGDRVLATVANRIRGRLRQIDIFGRYGGEEFCACLTDITDENARALAEALRRLIEEEPFVYGEAVFTVTISIGLAFFDPAVHKELPVLLSDADDALYEAKAAGRNRVVVHDARKSKGD